MKAVTVLVVEDNPLVMELIVKGMDPHCEVLTATDGADALLKVIDAPPDLIISDFKMPGMDGRQLYEKLRGREATRSIPFIFVANRNDIEEKLRPLGAGVEELITKPFFLTEFVQRTKKVVDRINLEKMSKKATRPGVIQGRLEEMGMLDLMQSLEMGQKNCRLTIQHEKEKGEMFFAGGKVVHAVLGALQGNDAAFKLILWSAGEFEIDFNASADKTTTTMSTQGLMMEAMRLLDEANMKAADSGG
ncbi:MAG: DUF4388 domain-containing protein [Acidobacteria bacterium]|nr:DUF4388 domain-containing protein [Acidobacteriota bacterium]